jgi:hypothetical protein
LSLPETHKVVGDYFMIWFLGEQIIKEQNHPVGTEVYPRQPMSMHLH